MTSYNKIEQYVELGHTPLIERISIYFTAILAIALFIPFLLSEIQFIALALFVVLSIFQLVGFVIRRFQKKVYNKTYNLYLIKVFIFTILFSATIVFNYYVGSKGYIIMLLVIAAMILLSILSFISIRTTISHLFHWRLKKVFPYERAREPITQASLKKLSKYIDRDKQQIYLTIQYAEKVILYGFSVYFVLWVVKTYKFQDVPVLSQLQNYIHEWKFIDFPILLSLFSILLALLTICWPIQARIIEEAEMRLAEKFGGSS